MGSPTTRSAAARKSSKPFRWPGSRKPNSASSACRWARALLRESEPLNGDPTMQERKDKWPFPKHDASASGVEGEGSYTGSKDYNERTQKFVESGKVDKAAHDAAP